MKLIKPFAVSEDGVVSQDNWTYYRDYNGYLTRATPNFVRPWFDGILGNRGILIEQEAEQLLDEPEDFSDSYWVKTSATVTSGEDDPTRDGTGAYLLEGTASDGSIGVGSIPAGSYVFSIFIADVDAGIVTIDADGTEYEFNIGTGTTDAAGARLEPYANGFYRVSLPYTAAGSHSIILEVGDNSVIIFGANLTSDTLSSYIDSATTRDADVLEPIGSEPRLLYSNIEDDSRINLLSYSEEFDQSVWVKNQASITADAAVAPDGTTSADLVLGTGGSRSLYQEFATTEGQAYTYSLFVQAVAGETSSLEIQFSSSAFGSNATLAFDPATSTVSVDSGTFDDYGVEDADNGYYRIWATKTADSTESIDSHITIRPGGASYGYYVWGAMLEPSATLSDYLKTEASPSGTEWLESATYSDGDVVMYNHINYVSVADNNTGNAPDESPTYWVSRGATDKWRPHDLTTGVNPTTSNPDLIQYIIQYPELVDAMSLLNLRANDVRIDVATIAGGNIVSSTGQIDLLNVDSRDSWYNYFYVSPAFDREYVTFDLFAQTGTVIIVTIENGDADAEIGKIIGGTGKDVGVTLADTYPSVRLQDLSTRTIDQTFGTVTITKRFSYRELDILVRLPIAQRTGVINIFSDLGFSTRTVFVGDEDIPELILYGLVNSVDFPCPATLLTTQHTPCKLGS